MSPPTGADREADVPRLNEHQQRHLLASCQYVDQLLRNVDVILASSGVPAPFEKHVDDTAPAQRKVISDYVARVRTQLVRTLAVYGLRPPPPTIGVLHAIRTSLSFVDIAIDELRPASMIGYGAVDPAAAETLTGAVEELMSTVQQFDAFLARGARGDFQARIARLGDGGPDPTLLALLEQIIDRHGLLEFRSALEIILERSEDPRYEIAVFGRVSTGKSSLLNYLLETTVLPVGVNPITATPTRLAYGASPRVVVSFADAPTRVVPLEALAEFATETGNPANSKRVTRLVAELPSALLRDGVVFVDTPGLGSLATSGTAEALAYLPRCDLGLLLVDASTTISPEDVATAARLNDAGIGVLVLLSKADRVEGAEQRAVVDYVTTLLEQQLGQSSPPVSMISMAAGHRALADRWVHDQLQPRLADHRRQARVSLGRKVIALRDAVEHALQSRRSRGERRSPLARNEMAPLADRLRAAAGAFDDARRRTEAIVDALPTLAPRVIADAAHRPDSSEHTGAALAAALERLAREEAATARDVLVALEARVSTTLGTVSRALNLPPVMDADPAPGLQELPRPELGEVQEVHGSPLARLLGKRVAVRQLTSALTAAGGDAVTRALSDYARLLADWVRRNLLELRARFNSEADACRAVIDRSSETPGRESIDAVQADLARLAEHLQPFALPEKTHP